MALVTVADADALVLKLKEALAALPADTLQALIKSSATVTRPLREADKAKETAALDAAVTIICPAKRAI